MGRAFYSPSPKEITVDPYPKWSIEHPFDPDSDDFFREAVYEAFVDAPTPTTTTTNHNPMADGPDDPAQMIADALHRPPSSTSSNSDEENGPPTPITIPTYIYDIPPTAALPSLSSLAQHVQLPEEHEVELKDEEDELDEEDIESDSESDVPPLIRFQLPIAIPSTPPQQRSRAIPIPTSTGGRSSYSVSGTPGSYSFLAYSPPPSVSPRIYNWSRSTAATTTNSSVSASPFSRFHVPRVISASAADR